MILLLMVNFFTDRISLAVKQDTRWLNAIHAAKFGALLELLSNTTISISSVGIRANRSRSTSVNCVARTVLFISQIVILKSILNNFLSCLVLLFSGSSNFFFLLHEPFEENIRSRKLGFSSATITAFSSHRHLFLLQNSFRFTGRSLSCRKFLRRFKCLLSSLSAISIIK